MKNLIKFKLKYSVQIKRLFHFPQDVNGYIVVVKTCDLLENQHAFPLKFEKSNPIRFTVFSSLKSISVIYAVL